MSTWKEINTNCKYGTFKFIGGIILCQFSWFEDDMFFSCMYKFVDPHAIINTYQWYADKYAINSFNFVVWYNWKLKYYKNCIPRIIRNSLYMSAVTISNLTKKYMIFSIFSNYFITYPLLDLAKDHHRNHHLSKILALLAT